MLASVAAVQSAPFVVVETLRASALGDLHLVPRQVIVHVGRAPAGPVEVRGVTDLGNDSNSDAVAALVDPVDADVRARGVALVVRVHRCGAAVVADVAIGNSSRRRVDVETDEPEQ